MANRSQGIHFLESDELDELFDYQPSVTSVSELSEDEDADTGSKASTDRIAKQTGSTRVLDLGHVLRAPRAAQYSTRAVYSMVKDEIVDLEPEYQRGFVWSIDKQSALIESIMRHFYVPPVMLSVQQSKDPKDETTYVCIDGKQRISSICAFLDNQIPLREPSTGYKFWYKEDPANGKTLALTAAQRRKFDNEQLTIVEFEGLTDETERDLFRRVQMGVTLSAAEKLGAHLGAWPEFIRQMVKRYMEPTPSLVHDESGNSFLLVHRGKDYLFMSQMALLILYSDIDHYLPLVSTIETFFKRNIDSDPSRTFRQYMQRTLKRYLALATHPRYGACIKPEIQLNNLGRHVTKPLSPVEFVHIGLLIFKFPDASVSQLFELVQGFKEHLRAQPKEAKFTRAMATTIHRYINTAKLGADVEPSAHSSRPKRARQEESSDSTDQDSDQPMLFRHRNDRSTGLDHNPKAGLFLGQTSETPSRNPLTNQKSPPSRR